MSARQKAEFRDAQFESPAAEKAVLGTMLVSSGAYWDWSEKLDQADFTVPLHRRIFKAMGVLARQNRVLAPPLILSVMEAGDANESPPIAYMTALKVEAKGIINIGGFVALMKECSVRRRLLLASQKIHDLASKSNPDATADEMLDAAGSIMMQATSHRAKQTVASIGDLADQVVKEMSDTMSGRRPSGIKVRLNAINELLGPLLPGHLIVIPGATSSGKTALMSQICEEVAMDGNASGQIQAEMMAIDVARRHVAMRSGVSASTISAGEINDADAEAVLNARDALRPMPFFIDAERGITLSGMMSRARKMKRDHDIKLLVIDHIREIRPDIGSRYDKEHEHITAVCTGAKDLAEELQIPVLLGAQFKQDESSFEIRTAKDIRRPHMGIVYGGSAIRQIADHVLFVHRPAYYLERAEPMKSANHYESWKADLTRWSGRAELVLTKRRGGRGYGLKEVAYVEHLTMFRDNISIAGSIDEPQERLF